MIKNGVNSTTVWKPSIIQKGEKQTRTKQTDKQIIFYTCQDVQSAAIKSLHWHWY